MTRDAFLAFSPFSACVMVLSAVADRLDSYYHNGIRWVLFLVAGRHMLKYDFEASVGYWILNAHQAYTRTFQQHLAPHGITFRQAQVLGCLAHRGPQSQRDLADFLLIEPPNLVGVIDRMEAARLVERRACDDDRRKKLVHPLPDAIEQWEKIAECGRAIREQAVKGFTATQLEQLREMLARIQLNLSALDLIDTP